MHVVEGVEGVFGNRLVGLGQLLEAIARIDPAQVEAPEQRGGIEHFQLNLRGLGPKRRIVNFEHPVEAVVVEIEERDVPPVVKGEGVVVLRPMRLALLHEGDAFVLPGLHLHHMAGARVAPSSRPAPGQWPAAPFPPPRP